MKLECTLKREGGTRAEIDGTEYHFEPLADGAHVANVEHTPHIDRFLSIPEAYKLYHGELVPEGVPVKLKPTVVSDPDDLRVAGSATSSATVLLGSSVHESEYEIGDALYQLGDIVAMAQQKSGLSADDWNALEQDDRHARIDMVLDDLAEAAEKPPAPAPAPEGGEPVENTEPAPPAPESREAMVAAYKAKFGKAPHYRLSDENLKAALASE